MKMMPGDFKNMKAIKDMKVVNAKRVEWWRIRRSKERMSKLLAERECWKNHMEGYAKAKAKLLAKMKIAAEEACSSTDRSSTARSSCTVGKSKVLDAIVVDKGHESQEGHESHAASTTP